jgi:SAM-dependent methyltransferase
VTARTECPICAATPKEKPYFRGTDWRVLRCPACTFAWVAEVVGQPEDGAFDWDEDIVAESVKRLPMYEDRLSRIERHRPEPRSWLDVGCGGGGMLRCVADHGYETEGVELSPSADRVARTLGIPVHRQPLKAARARLRRAPYGVVSYFHVLEHVHDPAEELATARHIVSDTGLLVVEVPYFDTFFWKLFGSRHRHFYRSHLSYFNATSLSTLLTIAGFDVLSLESVPYVMSVGWALRRLGGTAGGVRRFLPSAVSGRRLSINSGEYLLAVARKSPGAPPPPRPSSLESRP